MCLGSDGGSAPTKAPVAGGYGEVTYDGANASNAKYKLYDNTGKDITSTYKVDKKKQVYSNTSTPNPETGGNDYSTKYLYTRDA